MKKIPKCNPDRDTQGTCAFSDEPLYNIIELKKFYPKLYEEMINNLNMDDPETIDFLEEFDFYVLKKGTTIVHTTTTASIVEKNDKYFYQDNINWWKKYYPGQKDYKGGWFTYKTSFGGPKFNTELFYEIKKDVPIVYIPNFYRNDYVKSCGTSAESPEANTSEFYDCKYYKEIKKEFKKILNTDKAYQIANLLTKEYVTYDNLYSLLKWQSSHLIPGVKNWKKKGYDIISHLPSEYADSLALRIANLGFFGYISCDECEIYLTHNIMKKVLEHPYRYEFSKYHDLGSLYKYILKEIFDNEPESKLRVTSVASRTSGKYDLVEVPDIIVKDAMLYEKIEKLENKKN